MVGSPCRPFGEVKRPSGRTTLCSSRPARSGTYRPSRPVGGGEGGKTRSAVTRRRNAWLHASPAWGGAAVGAHPIPLEFHLEDFVVLDPRRLLELVELVQAIRAHDAKADRLPWPCEAAVLACGAGQGHNSAPPSCGRAYPRLARNTACPTSSPHTAPSSQLHLSPQARSLSAPRGAHPPPRLRPPSSRT